jgi:hypothetical protein
VNHATPHSKRSFCGDAGSVSGPCRGKNVSCSSFVDSSGSHRFEVLKITDVSEEYATTFFRVDPDTKGSTMHLEGKVKLSLCLTKHHAMKMYTGSEGISPRTQVSYKLCNSSEMLS